MKFKIIPKDTILILSYGEYSDYSLTGIYRTLQDIDMNKLIEEYASLEPLGGKDEYSKRYNDPEINKELWQDYYRWNNKFNDWIKDRVDLLEKVPHMELHLGDYGFRPQDISIYDNLAFMGQNSGTYV